MPIDCRGTTLKKGLTSVGPITSVTVDMAEADKIDVTTLANSTGYRDYLTGMQTENTITFEAEWNKGNAQTLLTDVRDASSDAYTFTLDETAISDSTYAGNARVSKLTITVDGYEGSTKMSAELKTTGDWTYTAGS